MKELWSTSPFNLLFQVFNHCLISSISPNSSSVHCCNVDFLSKRQDILRTLLPLKSTTNDPNFITKLQRGFLYTRKPETSLQQKTAELLFRYRFSGAGPYLVFVFSHYDFHSIYQNGFRAWTLQKLDILNDVIERHDKNLSIFPWTLCFWIAVTILRRRFSTFMLMFLFPFLFTFWFFAFLSPPFFFTVTCILAAFLWIALACCRFFK